MAKDPNENVDDENIEDAEGEDAEGTSDDGEKEEDTGGEGGDDAGEDKGEGEDDGDGSGDGAFTLPEKFKGKSAEEIAKSYVELEKSIEKKAGQRARDLAGIGKNREQKPKDGETPEWVKDALKGVDFSKMKPEDFATFMLNTIERRAQEIARNTYDAADSTKAQVQKDIETVTKSWPQLKENEGFRDMVLTLIENAATKGEILPLKEACQRVGKAMGLKPGAKKEENGGGSGEGEGSGEKKGKPGDRTGVERGTGAGGEGKKDEEAEVLAGLMKGSGVAGGMKGLY